VKLLPARAARSAAAGREEAGGVTTVVTREACRKTHPDGG
jgi:hypothetical protein